MSDKTQLQALTAALRTSQVCLSKLFSCQVVAGQLFLPSPTRPCWRTLRSLPTECTSGLGILLWLASSFPPLCCCVCTSIVAHMFACDVPSTPAAHFSQQWIHREVCVHDCERTEVRTSMQLFWGVEGDEMRGSVEINSIQYETNQAKLQISFSLL